MQADDIIAFVEESFAAFVNKHMNPTWSWDRLSLNTAFRDLAQHKLVEPPCWFPSSEERY